jgi:chemotaxis methyl-accepting protein methylase
LTNPNRSGCWKSSRAVLNLQGYLFVGHAESLLALTDKFTMVHRNSGTAYQKVEVSG